uniref:Uncharacterized protein n=1 Tax=Haptolina brevifila TaxID=156173 RepID=A0A7S2IUH2_9EUKA|mmetsp:Transcript_71873/g.142479  ORF Transcript_71873/g.142479 Transcript_71873/m.142479 type:complete len:134 (+) Transcript_71873:163-564(+)
MGGDPLLASAAEFEAFQARRKAQPRPMPPPGQKAPADQVSFNAKTDSRNKWPIELMGTSRRTHISFQEHVAYPLTRDLLFKQHGERSMQEYLPPGYIHPPYKMAGGANYFSTKPADGWEVMSFGNSRPIARSD